MLLSLFTMFMHLSLYIRNILLSVMVTDHSVMQTFASEEKKLYWPRKNQPLAGNKINHFFLHLLCFSAAGANKQWKNLCYCVLSNDSKPVYLILLGRPSIDGFQIYFNWLFLTSSFVTNCLCSIRRKHKIRHFVELTDKFF